MILDHFKYDFSVDEKLKDYMFSNVELMKRSMLGTFKDNEYVRYIHLSNIIKNDSKKLKEQKNKLLNQAKNNYIVDYNVPIIDNAITKKLK